MISNLSPLQHLFGQPPDYSHLQSFGCACFPFTRPYNSHKLYFKSKPCVFLGYSLDHLSYRCLDHQIGQVYISRHVVFDESSFPFKQCNESGPSIQPLQWLTRGSILGPHPLSSMAPSWPFSLPTSPSEPTFIPMSSLPLSTMPSLPTSASVSHHVLTTHSPPNNTHAAPPCDLVPHVQKLTPHILHQLMHLLTIQPIPHLYPL